MSSVDRGQQPTQDDAGLLVQLFALAQTDRVARSFLWYYEFFGHNPGPEEVDYKGFIDENPRGSEGYFKWTAIASFFETVGVLVRNGVLARTLVFDRWPVEWYWRYLEPLVRADRDMGRLCDTAYYADNFEWLAQQAADWRSEGKGYASWRGSGSGSGQ